MYTITDDPDLLRELARARLARQVQTLCLDCQVTTYLLRSVDNINIKNNHLSLLNFGSILG
jgi:hypothetical protein